MASIDQSQPSAPVPTPVLSFQATGFHKRLVTVLVLGFSSGLPLALTGQTLQAWFATSNVDLMTIGLLSWIGMPYVWKFLWAPLMDRFCFPFLGRRRGWILVLQLSLIGLTVLLGSLSPDKHVTAMALVALALAFASASQDIVIDAYRTDLLPEQELGSGASANVLGYRMAMFVSGAVAIIIGGAWSWHLAYWVMALCFIPTLFATWLGPEPSYEHKPPMTLRNAVVEPFIALKREHPQLLWILLLILLYKLTDAFIGTMTITFFLRGLQFSAVTVGAFYKVTVTVGTLLGVFIGGIWMRYLNLYQALLYFGILQAASNLLYMLLAIVGKHFWFAVGVTLFENLCAGLGTIAFLAFLMHLCDKRYSATQFAILSSFSAIGRVVLGPFAAWVIEHAGWTNFFLTSVVIAIPSLIMLKLLKRELIKPSEYRHAAS